MSARAGVRKKASQNRGSVAVVGAGAFGGWTALFLRRAGFKVTCIDAYGPGHSRASSGGDTRVIRTGYNGHRGVFDLSVRSLEIWRGHQKKFRLQTLFETGCLWILKDEGRYLRDSIPHMKSAGLKTREMTAAEGRRRYPQINADDVQAFFLEQEAGYLLARRSCDEVMRLFEKEGGTYVCGRVSPIAEISEKFSSIEVERAGAGPLKIRADHFVFACGPWLSEILPRALRDLVRPTRQELFFFGGPAGSRAYENFPAWIEIGGEKVFYGIPGNEHRGFKIGDDSKGEPFDPTNGERMPTPEKLAVARAQVEWRFPEFRGAPLVEARVCQYENTPDNWYILSALPGASHVWVAGGGSGHGYKNGPAIGERMALAISGKKSLPDEFSVARFR